MNKETLVIFKEKSIRRTWFNEAWWFVITDVIAAITNSAQPAGYIKDMRRREPELNKGWGQIAVRWEKLYVACR
jgi:DNA-damage-inducible protein D